jgi:hypothetical protein
MEPLFLGMYWKNRKATIAGSATVIYDVLDKLSVYDNRLSKLKVYVNAKVYNKNYDTTGQKEALIQQLAETILEAKKADIKKYHPGTPADINFHEKIGFTIAFEVQGFKGFDINITIGAYEFAGYNNWLISFPKDFSYDYRYIDELFRLLVTQLSPYYGVVWSRPFMDKVSKQAAGEVKIGWMNYFSKAIYKENVPSSIEKEHFYQGFLTRTTAPGELFSAENPVHSTKAFALIDHFKKKEATV